MKIKSVKLRDAHEGSSNASFCSILWDLQSHHLVTASSSQPSVSIHDPLLPSHPPRVLRHHRDGVTALAISPNSTCLASGSIDHSVKLYKFPGGEFETNITRFTLPIRALAFNKSGSMLAAAGDDEGIKLINTIDGSISRVLKGHRGPVTGLAFDPNGEYLASIDSTGTVIYWELQSGRTLYTLKGVAPDTGMDTSVLNVLSWSPDGETLAVPGLKNDIVMYDRDTAEKLFTLRGDHMQPICFMSWSPNGRYMATSSLDKQVLIWDVKRKQDIDRQKFDDRICCMAWKPIGNALAVIDVMGKYGVWESVVPSSMKSPTEDIPNSQSRNNGLLFYDEEDQEVSMSGSLSDLGESEFPSRKRLRKQLVDDYDQHEDVYDELSLVPKAKPQRKVHRVNKEILDKEKDALKTVMSFRPKLQEAFQPGSTPLAPGKRHFLCYNMLGSITTMEQDEYSHIEIDFHDTSIGPRVPPMTDHYGFTMASLNENGSVFANPCKSEKNMSTLMYRPFCSWANNSEWYMRFEGEEVRAVALGSTWVAAITSLNFLRIFTNGGLQKHILSLNGPVVTAAGFNDELAIVNHVSDCLPSNEQMLEFTLFNISKGTQVFRGRLPLTPGSYLTWFGFSEEGQISSYDSKGFLRVFTSQYGGNWLPLFSANKERKSGENYWVIGLNASKLFCVVCKNPNTFPQVLPKPVLTLISLSFPLASSDLGEEALENEFMLNNLHLSKIQKQIEATAGEGLDTTSLDDEAFDIEAAQDRCIFRLIASCCNSDKLVRAIELVKLLSVEKSVRGAIQLATALKLPILAERFNEILEERLRNKTMDSNTGLSSSKHDLAVNKPYTATERLEPFAPSSAKLSAPVFTKKVKPLERVKFGKQKTGIDQSANLEDSKEVKDAEKNDGSSHVNGVKEVKNSDSQGPSNSFPKLPNIRDGKKDPSNPVSKSSNEESKKVVGERPSNPFLKSTVK
ncbi:Transducin family protein / WD-40 repeat family protein isoform 2 [Hibiscus syriacus]|uniref:Transducin family protein / WD-40 repeat family protein isoform 2 n=1 Tax=Hibiscus syriacus TaxID=106335 RepID=A0A6A3BHD8_HIBSY|nr:WD repeat and HMG-box DNA-binding protein 1 [Hibiscus syriacus]KAE8716446.1 Transducin family protein / WD-40 repeat family protein isoform 2 [Hibiscus syriacus]